LKGSSPYGMEKKLWVLLFEGRFGIVRTVVGNDKTNIILYIGEGARLQWQKNALEAANDERGIQRFKQTD